MKQVPAPMRLTVALWTLGLIGAALLPSPLLAAGIATDYINATKAGTTNAFLSNVGIGTTSPTQMLDVMGNLRVTGTGTFAKVVGNGSGLSNIVASQVGAVATNDARYLASLTNASDFASAAQGALAATALQPNGNGSQLSGLNVIQVSGALSATGSANGLSGCPSGADAVGLAAAVQAQLPAIGTAASNAQSAAANAQTTANDAQTLASNALAAADSKLSPTGNGSQLVGITVDQVSGALSNNNASEVFFGTNLTVGGSLILSNGLTVVGAVSGITAAQVGAVDATDTRYLNALTNIAAGSVGSVQLAPNAVQTTNIANNAVTINKIGPSAVGPSQIAANAVTPGKIGVNAVGSSQIAASAVIAGKIAANAVGSSQIATGAVTSVQLASNLTIKGTLAVQNLIASNLVYNGVYTNSTIAINGSVVQTNALMPNCFLGNVGVGVTNPVTLLDVAGDTTVRGQLFITTPDGSNVQSAVNIAFLSTYPVATLANGVVTTEKIAPGAVGGAQIASNSITAAQVGATSLNDVLQILQNFGPYGDVSMGAYNTPGQ